VRRREPAQEAVTRPPAPRWIWSPMDGIKHFGGVTPEGHIVIGGDARRQLEQARDDWCLTQGCWRPGTKTCEQVAPIGKDCGARERAGS
jgi:hypothetical protein